MNRSSRWLLIAAGVAALLLVVNVALTFRNTRQLHSDARWVAHTQRVITGFENVLSLMKDAETGHRGFIVTGEVRYLEPYQAALAGIDRRVDELERLTSDNPHQLSQIPDLRKRIATRLQFLSQSLSLRQNEGFEAARQAIATDRGKRAMDALRTLVAEMTQRERVLLRTRSQRSEQTYRLALFTGLLSGLSAVAGLAAFLVLLRRHLAARTQAAAVIAEQSERLRTTLASIGDAVITTDTTGRITNLNAAAELLTGWTNSEAAGQTLDTVFRIVNEETRQRVENPAIRALAEGVIVGLANHTILIAKDDTERPIDDSAAPIRCKAGEIVGCVLVFRDITERHRADRVLRESEARKTAMFETTLDSIISIDHEGTIVEFNSAAERTFGHRREDVLGQELAAVIIPPAYRELHRRGLAHYLATGEGPFLNQRLELSALHANGMEFPIELTVTRIPVEGPPLFTAYVRDITQRTNAEQLLRESEERFRTLADNMSQFAWMADGNGWIFWYNQRWYDYTHTTLEEMQGWGWKKVHHPDHVDRVVERLQKSWDTGEPWEDTFPLRAKDGNYRWFLSRALPIRDATGNIVLWFGTNTDVTEQRRMENELRQLAADMSQTDRRKNEFLAMLAHELRNPLAPIRNALQIMRHKASRERQRPEDETVQSASEMMERQIGQLVHLVDDLLDVSRISRGKIDLRRKRVELVTIIHQAIETSRPAIESARHQLTVTIPPQPIYLHADPMRLAQVFGNLLNNSCKYSEPEGHISLTAEVVDGSQSAVTSSQSSVDSSQSSVASSQSSVASKDKEANSSLATDHWPLATLVVTVRDTGIGIPADMLPNVFDMFTQVDQSLERSQGGLGIGLTLVKRLVELHGGSVSAHSEGAGRGSEFVVRLPNVDCAPQRAGSSPTPAESSPTPAGAEDRPARPTGAEDRPARESAIRHPKSRRILVVDDNRDAATSLAMLLKFSGHQTHTTHDGLAAVEAAETFKPDVVLLDIGLPKLNGHEVARQIRQQPWGKAMTLVALTGWGQDEDRRKSQEAGFDGHLVKPVEYETLAKLLDELHAETAT